MKTPHENAVRRAAIIAADVINSATPLETSLAGVHPRMLTDEAAVAVLKSRLSAEPWAGWMKSMTQQGLKIQSQELPARLIGTPHNVFDVRQLGEQLILHAFLFRFTGSAASRDRATYLMDRLTAEAEWGHSLIYGHWARGFGFALDWLWNDLDLDARDRYVETLYARSKTVFDLWSSYVSGEPFGYTWNISAVVLGGLTATAACLYGERPDIAPLANMAWEKMRCQSAALGPDGVSPEGVMYGGYYTGYLAISFLLAESMFGFDLFETTPWLHRYARALHAQTIPQAAWKSDDMFFNQGDAHGGVFGHEGNLRVLAGRLKDSTAAWFADMILQSGKMGTGPFSCLLHDPDVMPVEPAYDPPLTLLEDFGIAILRENRQGTGSAAAFKSGPNVGHYAAKRFSHPLGGGHMHPNNGELQIFSHGEWILRHPGYVYKDSAYHNTLLINGMGQYGDKSEWLEDLPYRKRRRHPFMETASHNGEWDYCIANMTDAYPAELGLTSLRRHLVYIRPDQWILLDAVESERPVLPEALFHTGFVVSEKTNGVFQGTGETAGCQIRLHHPETLTTIIEEQVRLHSGGNAEGTMPLLRVKPKLPAVRHLLITEIVSYSLKDSGPTPTAQITIDKEGNAVQISSGRISLSVRPFRMSDFGNEPLQ